MKLQFGNLTLNIGHNPNKKTESSISEKRDFEIRDKYLRKFTKDNVKIVYVIYAYGKNDEFAPWIYGVYTSHFEAFDDMQKMKNSKEYGHLVWSHNILELKE